MISDLSGEGLKDYQTLAGKIETWPQVQAVTPVVYNTVLITGPARSAGALLKGMDFIKERQVADWLKQLPAGNLPEEDENTPSVLVNRWPPLWVWL
jgi:lipoprotein-releasing system permease protein